MEKHLSSCLSSYGFSAWGCVNMNTQNDEKLVLRTQALSSLTSPPCPKRSKNGPRKDTDPGHWLELFNKFRSRYKIAVWKTQCHLNFKTAAFPVLCKQMGSFHPSRPGTYFTCFVYLFICLWILRTEHVLNLTGTKWVLEEFHILLCFNKRQLLRHDFFLLRYNWHRTPY